MTPHTRSPGTPNRLIHEKSPYLLQHAYNPVDWYSWGDEAFAEARTSNKPIFLSIGYSTCHWCHVMEHESFESEAIAAIMNMHFVCIKVDREERPDVDRVYMTALQSMGQSGGWPMSMFLTPDLRPFYGGTYYPPESRYGRIGFPDLLKRIHDIWENEKEKVLESASNLTEFLRQAGTQTGGESLPGRETADVCFKQIADTYDRTYGGFGDGPKFPRPSVFTFLLLHAAGNKNAEALQMTAFTLRKMAAGGVYDHIGGGFHRYSVDGEWRVPHFEKMLYDQAQLVHAYLDTYLLTGDEHFASVARDILAYVSRDLTDVGGAFYSAEDADSPKPDAPEEQGEGAFYIWSQKELQAILGNDTGLFCYYYGVEPGGNALVDPQHEFTGRNILFLAHNLEETAQQFGLEQHIILDILKRSKEKLLDARSRRPGPHLDDKILTSWNGLMIGAFARAGQVLDDAEYVHRADRAAEFILQHLYDPAAHTLLRRYRDGEAKYEGHLDDYAFLVDGLVHLYEASFESRWLSVAKELTASMIRLFRDDQRGGFFDTTGNDTSILVRTKEQYDGAEPSGNSVAVLNLLKLSQMTNHREWQEVAEQTLRFFSKVLEQHPNVLPRMVATLACMHATPKQVVIVGRKEDERTKRLLRVVHSRFLPNRVLLLADPQHPDSNLPAFVGTLSMLDGQPTAYVCENFVCQLPTTDSERLAELLSG